MKRLIIMLAVAGLGVVAGRAVAQDAPAQESPAGERAPVMNPDQMRQRLERRLHDLEELTERTRKAIVMLEEGATPAEVLRTFEGVMRGFEGGRTGPGGPPGERPMPGPGPGPREGGREGGPGRPDGMGRGPGMGPMGEGEMGERPMFERHDGPATPEERERVLGFLREHVPPMAERIQRLLEAEPEVGVRIFSRLIPQLREAADSRRRDPEGFESRVHEIMAGIDVLDAIRAVRTAQEKGDREAGAAAMRALRESVARQFDARVQVQLHEVEMLERRIRAFQEEIEQKRLGRDRMIERMVRQVHEGMRPGGPPGADRRRPPPE